MQLIFGCSFNEAFPPLPVVSWLYYLVPCSLWRCAPLQQMFTKEAESFLWLALHTVPTNETVTFSFIRPQNYWKLGIKLSKVITNAHPNFPRPKVKS